MRERTHQPSGPVIVLVSLIVVLAGAGAAWWYWIGTVYYSLSRLEHAFKTHDRYLVEKHMDLPHLTRQMVDDLYDEGMKELQNQPLSPLEQAVAPLGIAFAQMLKPRLVDEMQFAITRGIETGSVDADSPEAPPAGGGQVDDVVAEFRKDIPRLKPEKLRSVRSHGTTATVELAGVLEGGLPGEADLVPNIQVRFVRTPERFWRATEVENFKDIIKFWKGLEEKRLEVANEPVRKMLRETVAVIEATKEQGLNDSGTGKDAWLAVTLKNNASAGVTGLIADVSVRDAGGELKKLQIQDGEPIPPGETKRKTWPLGLNLADNVDKLIYDTDPAQLKVTVDLRYLVLSDGRTIKLAESLDEVPKMSKESAKPAPPSLPVQSL